MGTSVSGDLALLPSPLTSFLSNDPHLPAAPSLPVWAAVLLRQTQPVRSGKVQSYKGPLSGAAPWAMWGAGEAGRRDQSRLDLEGRASGWTDLSLPNSREEAGLRGGWGGEEDEP